MTEDRIRLAATLGWLTFCLTAAAIALYEAGEPGWAQLCLVFASGLAGACVVVALGPRA